MTLEEMVGPAWNITTGPAGDRLRRVLLGCHVLWEEQRLDRLRRNGPLLVEMLQQVGLDYEARLVPSFLQNIELERCFGCSDSDFRVVIPDHTPQVGSGPQFADWAFNERRFFWFAPRSYHVVNDPHGQHNPRLFFKTGQGDWTQVMHSDLLTIHSEHGLLWLLDPDNYRRNK